MTGLGFDEPVRLWLLAGVAALAVAYVLLQRRRSAEAVPLPGLGLVAASLPRLGWRKHVAAAFMLLALGTTTAAFAAPTAEVQVARERATVIVALDVSLSMAAEDVSPDRITEAKAAAREFVAGLPEKFNVGLVAFSGSAATVVEATQDHAAVEAAIDTLQLGNGTAIGEAVFSGLDAVAGVPGAAGQSAAPARLVLLSDGANTTGRSLVEAAEQAKAAGVPVSTIAYGTESGVVSTAQGVVNVPVDAPSLAALAQETGGQAYEAASGSELQGVYADIGSQVGYTTERRGVAAGVAGLGLLAAVAAAGSALAWSPRPV
ncbi:VWA domain-containing protein [Motilibacter aurantiacus]|uniref:VWA domain-containing protein n=1 Tax=Motilibacter aurantiacus TaxID=2714955 RepID=UPI00140E1813|nr:VWA domain-containing protein [Motilibacter aurantiacus]NHC46152.1 VWA domain-containing protein [Motilibacter aurantiacus]